MEVSTQEGPQTRHRVGSVKVPFMRPDAAASKIPKPTTELSSLLAESPTIPPINLHPASLEDFRRILLQNYAPKYHARAPSKLACRTW